jgi:hypothetical protein
MSNHVIRMAALLLVFGGLTMSAWADQPDATDLAKIHPTLDRLLNQEDGAVKAWVFFADKGYDSPEALAAAVKEVASNYDRHAVERRRLRGPGARGEALFTERDLPVAAAYLAQVEQTGARVHVTSRWLNAASVWVERAQVEQLATLPCVAKMQPVARTRSIIDTEIHEQPATDPNREEVPLDVTREGTASVDLIDYGRSQPQLEQINLIALHDEGFTGAGVIVGILDTGFRRTHEAFNYPGHPVQVIAEYDFVDNDPDAGMEPGDPSSQHNHGTLILGCLGAYYPGELVGGAYDASFVLAKTEDTTAEYQAEEDNFVAGLEFIEQHGADMSTASLGYIDWYNQSDLDGLTAVTTIACNTHTGLGVHHCNAAGNEYHDSNPNTSSLIAPADAFQVLTCGAVSSSGQIASFSSEGPTADGRVKPELLARGVSTHTVSPSSNSSYTTADGTSLSTPVLACGIACLIQANPDWTVDQMRSNLFYTADYYVANGTFDPLYVYGYGVANIFGTMQDCNENGTPDAVDIANGTSEDCQPNGTPDECEIADGTSQDCNGNDTPDECDLATPGEALVDTEAAINGWVEISGTGTPLGLSDDGEATVSMPFTTPLFTVQTVRVGNNGGIAFTGSEELPYDNAGIPSNSVFGGAQSLLPLWDDIDSETGDVYFATIGTAPNRTFIVEWYNRPHYSGDSIIDGDETTFQVQVFETPIAGIYAQYLYADVDFEDAEYDNGASATVGYQRSGSAGHMWSLNQPVLSPDVVLSLQRQGESASPDCNFNNVPDECDPSGDFDLSGSIDLIDFDSFAACLTDPCGEGSCAPSLYEDACCVVGDYDLDGDVDLSDVAALMASFGG